MAEIDNARIWISEATEADHGAIREILGEACRWLADQGIRQWTVPFGEDYIRRKIAGREFHLVNLAGAPVGVFRLLWSDFEFWGNAPDNAAYIHTLAVLRKYAGRGVTQRVIAWVAERAKEQGKEYLRLDCMAGNQRLRDYYERLGFTPVGARTVRDFQVTLFQRPIADEAWGTFKLKEKPVPAAEKPDLDP
jgi:ribosomal protein S18 acetylase RimI-like enzyme